jgi:hypothetical protein
MRSRRILKSDAELQKDSKAKEALRAAFKHEVRPDDYLLRVWATSILAAGYFAYTTATRSGQFDFNLLIPSGGWHGIDPYGGLYLNTWGNILVNALQAGFCVWGGFLFFLGVYRVFTSHKYVFACFSLATAFFGFAFFLPNWTEVLLRMLIEKCPILVQ